MLRSVAMQDRARCELANWRLVVDKGVGTN